MFVGVVPGTAVVANGSVAELGWFETITDRGTAVGFVANRETLGSVVVTKGVAVNPAEPDDPDATNDDGLGEVTWRAPRTWSLALRWSAWAATKMGTTARTAGEENFMEGGNKGGTVGTKPFFLYFTKTKNRKCLLQISHRKYHLHPGFLATRLFQVNLRRVILLVILLFRVCDVFFVDVAQEIFNRLRKYFICNHNTDLFAQY